MTRIAPVLLVAVVAAVLVLAAPAAAGIYPVHACEPTAGDVNHSWVSSRDTSLLLAFANCPPKPGSKDRQEGLVTQSEGNPAAPRTSMGLFNHSAWTFRAPAGASLAKVTYRHTFCGIGGFQAGLLNAADKWLDYAGPNWCGNALPDPVTLDLHGTTALRLITMCAELRCEVGSTTQAWATLRSATVWVQDWTLPSVSGGGPLATESWVGGTVPAPVYASDNVGVSRVELWLGDKQAALDERRCDYTYVVPCPSSGATYNVNTRIVEDGLQVVTFRTLDSAGNANAARRTLYVDNSAPASPRELSVDGGVGWHTANDFVLRWTDPPQGSAAPITGVQTAICPRATPLDTLSGCVRASHPARQRPIASGIRVPGEGEWTARVWLADAVGNENPLSAEQVPLRFDGSPPEAVLADIDAQDPRRITVVARDDISGVAGGDIEISREGSSRWISLPVESTATGLTTLVDDAALPDGIYDVRARVVDAAGNERTTTVRASGAQAHLSLPLRVPTVLRAGRPITVRGSNGRRRTALARTATAPFGSPVQIRGRLTVPGGNPLAGADVDVLERTALPDQPWIRTGITRTDSRGRFAYRVLPGPSRTVLFRYGGTQVIRAQTAAVQIRIRAATSLRVNRPAVVNGEDVVFRGRVRGGPIPSVGKLVQLQAYSRGGWRTFATPRARARSHRWSYRYRFTATRGTVRYRFRAVVPAEGGFPFVRGGSRSVKVIVRGL
jgi:hypothetical protein